MLRKFGSITVWKECIEVFDNLPLAGVIEQGTQKIFCVHGGISPSLKFISDLENIQRTGEIPHDGIISDILWSDPFDNAEHKGYQQSQRGAGYFFGADVVE